MKLIIMTLLLLPIHFAFAQGDVKGGDPDEAEFYQISGEIFTWVNNGGPVDLNFYGKIDGSTYLSKMNKVLGKFTVTFTNKIVYLKVDDQKFEKTCINYFRNSHPKILCNIGRYEELSADQKRVLVHHEIAGLAGIENNQNEKSDYFLSDQLALYMEDVVVRRLGFKRREERAPGNAASMVYDPQKKIKIRFTFNEAVEANRKISPPDIGLNPQQADLGGAAAAPEPEPIPLSLQTVEFELLDASFVKNRSLAPTLTQEIKSLSSTHSVAKISLTAAVIDQEVIYRAVFDFSADAPLSSYTFSGTAPLANLIQTFADVNFDERGFWSELFHFRIGF
jgi:hypothetical protein